MTARFLVFGKTGQVGSGLSQALSPLGTVRCVGRETVDLVDLAALEHLIQAEKPAVIVNAAAYTHVDQAERDVETAHLVNAEAPAVMAEMASAVGAWFIHYSTDYVFDGESETPYTEDRPTCPLNEYGASKLAGEDAVREATERYVILRTSWVYSNHGRNFLNTILRLASEHRELRIVDDQTGTPTYAGALSTNTARIIGRLCSDWGNLDLAGIFNVTCSGSTTWFGFAREILLRRSLDDVSLTPITTDEFPTLARRPRYSVLDNTKIQRVYGVNLPDWREALRECLAHRAVS